MIGSNWRDRLDWTGLERTELDWTTLDRVLGGFVKLLTCAGVNIHSPPLETRSQARPQSRPSIQLTSP